MKECCIHRSGCMEVMRDRITQEIVVSRWVGGGTIYWNRELEYKQVSEEGHALNCGHLS